MTFPVPRTAIWLVLATAACSDGVPRPGGGLLDGGGPPHDARVPSDAGLFGECNALALIPAAEPVHGDGPPFRGIKVMTSGAGSGVVVATVNGSACDAACLEGVAPGSLVHLTAEGASGSWFRGWLSACSGRHACDVVAMDNLLITADFTPEPNRVFLSSIAHDGNFGGIAGGDAICQQLASDAGLTGTYHIVLDTGTAAATVDWRTRAPAARGWIRTDGEPAGDTEIGACAGWYNVRLDEHGNDLGDVRYWTFPSTTFGGGSHCSDWTSNADGTTANVSANFEAASLTAQLADRSISGIDRCWLRMHFLCAGIDRNVEVRPVATRGRLAFASRGRWDTTAGIEAGDRLCASESRAAGRSGSFRALVATSTAPAIARFDTAGPPWVRADGLPLLPTATAFASATYLDIAPGVAIDGTLLSYSTSLVIGSHDLHAPGPLSDTCNDWTSRTPAANGASFNSWIASSSGSTGCGAGGALCLED